ncbi:MAG TPA: chorismate mutase [Oscillatoriaceae cyanobacterium]
MSIRCRGIRGATTAADNTPDAIVEATRALLEALIAANGVQPDDVASAFFTTTPDLDAAFPARAARQLGWLDVALLGAQEMAVPDQPPRCIRVLIHWNTDVPQSAIRHVYSRGAEALRPDRTSSDGERA